MRHWSGRSHVETLRAWPELVRTVDRIATRPEVFSGALLIGSLSRGKGDAISDVDLVAVTQPGLWRDAWATRLSLSSGALVSFDRAEGKAGIAGHSWLTPTLVKVECLITEVGQMTLAGSVVVLLGEDDLLDGFKKVAPFTRRDIDDYATELRETSALSDIERAYGDLITLLRRELRPAEDSTQTVGGL